MARVHGQVYFIDGVLPGELVEFEPRKKFRGKFQGKLKRVIEPSVHRTAPRCEYFGVCGGCAQQHIDPAAQLTFKEKTLFDNLARIAKIEPPQRLKPIQAAVWAYRRKARPGVRHVAGKGGVLVGFRERNSSRIASLMRCHTLDAELSALLPGLHNALQQVACRRAIPQIEMTSADNALALVLRHLQPLRAADSALLKGFAMAAAAASQSGKELQFFVQPGGLDSITPLWPESPQPLHYRLADHALTLRFGPSDFIQVNAEVNRLMINLAMDLLALEATDAVLDLFCGLGNFTLPIARRGARALGIEGSPGLLRRARENAALNQLVNAEFQRMDLMNSQPMGMPHGGETSCGPSKFNKMLLDPPRSGAAEVVRQLIPAIQPRVIVYVSCNPATLARDAAALTRLHGYQMTHAGVIDMFPHTAQVESIARFER